MTTEFSNTPMRGDLPRYEGYDSLPPREHWLVDILDTQLETPVDERGLVDPHQLVELVKSTISPEYEWPNRLSTHHLYWKGYWYGFPSAGLQAESFRELPIHRILVPRVFENVLHKVTVPPDVPSEEVMEHRIESWSVAKSLFKSVRTVVQWEKRADQYLSLAVDGPMPEGYTTEDEIGRAILRDTVQRHFRGVEMHMERLHTVPSEFRLIEPDQQIGTSAERRQQYVQQLGRVVVPRALPMTRLLRAA